MIAVTENGMACKDAEKVTPASSGGPDWPAAPKSADEFAGFVAQCFALDGVDGICLHWRGEADVCVQMWMNGAQVPDRFVACGVVVDGMNSLLPCGVTMQLFGGITDALGQALARERMDWPNVAGGVRYELLPVYQGGMTVALRRCWAAKRGRGLMDLGLPDDLVTELRRVAFGSTGGFFFTGTAGTGKTTLMCHAVNDLHLYGETANLSQSGRLPRWSRVGVVGFEAGHLINNKVFVMQASYEQQECNTREPKNSLCWAKQHKPDLVVFGDLMDTVWAAEMQHVVQSGVAAMGTCWGDVGRFIERTSELWPGGFRGLRGWTCSRLLPVLCQSCRIPLEGDSDVSDRGMGCRKCRSLGITRRQLLVDLWEVDADGIPQQLFSQIDQAKDLIRRGIVTLADAEKSLGPLERAE